MQNSVFLNERSVQTNFKKFTFKKYSINYTKTRSSYKSSENKLYLKYFNNFHSIIHPLKLKYEKTPSTSLASSASSDKSTNSSKKYSSLFKYSSNSITI